MGREPDQDKLVTDGEAQGDRASFGRALLAWIGAGIGVVLLIRLVVQGVRAVGYSAAWLDDLVLSELVSGLRFSLFDLGIVLLAVTVGIVSGLASRRDIDDPRDGR